MDFMELHAHAEFSNLRLIDSNIKLEGLIQSAYEKGLKGIAITDHESLSGHVRAIKKAKEYKDTDFKVALGNEIYLVDSYENQDKYWHFILIAKNEEGYKQLKELSSMAWANSYYHKGMERVVTTYEHLETVVKKNKGNLIGSTACLGGFFPHIVKNYIEQGTMEAKREISKFIKYMVGLFGEDFYIELQPAISEEQIEFNKMALKIANGYNIKYIITNDVHYLNKEDRILHESFLKSKSGEREMEDFYESTYLKNSDEIIERMKNYMNIEDIEEGIKNTMKIYNKIEQFDLAHEMEIPERKIDNVELNHIFRDYYDKYKYIKNFADSKFIQDKFLLHEIENGFIEKEQEFNEENLERLDEELGYLWELGEKESTRRSAYYNTMDNMIDIIWDDKGGNSLLGVARGSITGMYFAYLIDTIQVNPLKFNLPAWRHIHPSREDIPDIDIDTEASKRHTILEAMKENFGKDNVLNVCTFKTEGSKSAILTSCRGLDIPYEIGQQLADMIPIDRGASWTIEDCLYGNKEKERKPIREFIKLIEDYPNLKETALSIEGIVCGRSIHAAGLIIYNEGYLKLNSLMKAPNGQFTTCWDLKDSEYAGNLKFDFLTVENLDKIRETLNLLIKNNIIEWQGSLRETYNKYLHPDVLDYDSQEMWDMLESGEIIDLFQFSTDIGIQSAKAIKPKSLKEMSVANSVMRLAGEKGKETPMEKFIKFKNDISLWYEEMRGNGLNEKEIKILETHLLSSYGLATEQEDLMELSMNPKISNFDVTLANKLRKSIAKKSDKLIKEIKEIFYKKGLEIGTRKEMLDYLWNFQIKNQAGYAFSRNHTIPYSTIGLQDMNLVHKYGKVYWNTACLNVNAGAVESDKDKNTEYGKIAKAIGEMQDKGIRIKLPDINTADFSFSPSIKDNSIIFGLKGLNGVGDETVKTIIENRPYKSLEDFLYKIQPSKVLMINLIKAGSFDELEQIDRVKIMKKFLKIYANDECEIKEKLTMQNFSKILELNILPESLKFYEKVYNFRKYIYKTKKTEIELNSSCKSFFNENLRDLCKLNKEYKVESGATKIIKKEFDKFFNKLITPVKEWISTNEALKLFNQKTIASYTLENWDKYCNGSLSTWEMDSLSCYFSGHELENIDESKYSISNYNDMPENPIIYEEKEKYNKYVLYKIAGTVLDKNKNRHTITLLTKYGVVTVKFYAGQFGNYDKQVSKIDKDTGKNKILEKSWFKRGNKLIISGFRRGDQFVSKKYWNSIYQHSVILIEDIKENGNLVLKYERESGE